jgi:hypothetical protein
MQDEIAAGLGPRERRLAGFMRLSIASMPSESVMTRPLNLRFAAEQPVTIG